MSKIKHCIFAFALAAVVGMSAAVSACTIKTKHPRAVITIEFNDKTYDIEYTLYRNLYPQTVQHFIELASEGYYDGMIVHDYKSTDWFTGAYSYVGDEDEVLNYSSAYTKNSMREYLETNSKETEYYDLFEKGALTPSVYKQIIYDENGNQTISEEDKLPTLIGEFSNNDHVIEKGALSASLGCLKMYYYDKGSTNQKVAIKNSAGQILEHDYQYNCATSVFALQVGSTSSYGIASYCVFAQLRNDDASETLDELLTAISDYITDELGGSSGKFTSSTAITVDNLDSFAKDGGQAIDTTFTVTSDPIIVKSVKITKY